jgi:hypothetical protein
VIFYRQSKLVIGKGTSLLLLSHNDMTVLDIQVTGTEVLIVFFFLLQFLMCKSCKARYFYALFLLNGYGSEVPVV